MIEDSFIDSNFKWLSLKVYIPGFRRSFILAVHFIGKAFGIVP